MTTEEKTWEPSQDFQDGYDLGSASERLRVHQEVKKAVEAGNIMKWLRDNEPVLWSGENNNQ